MGDRNRTTALEQTTLLPSTSHLPVETFGRGLLETGDLDPIYVALFGARLSPTHCKRWLLAYWCFYDAGFASFASEQDGKAFWRVMDEAAENRTPSPPGGKWPRGAERRHFRGGAAVNAIEVLSQQYPNPARMVDYIAPESDTHVADVISRVELHPMFGPWIGFKAADMIDRVLGRTILFNESSLLFYEEPAKAAAILWEEWRVGPEESADVVAEVLKRLSRSLMGFVAPPRGDRFLGPAEFETILCKWKAHRNGHYRLGKDTLELERVLARWKDFSPVAALLLANAPEWKGWEQ